MPDQDSPSHNRHLPRVLIVDDAPEVRHDLALLLQLTGEVQVVGEASNGAQAINQVAALRPNVVLMDLEMPVMDGFQAAREIKSRWPDCRVIALTIHDGESERQKAAEAGAASYLVKGAALETLLRVVSER